MMVRRVNRAAVLSQEKGNERMLHSYGDRQPFKSVLMEPKYKLCPTKTSGSKEIFKKQ